MTLSRLLQSTWLKCFVVESVFIGPFAVATPPLEAPYHQYRVSGSITRPLGGSRANFAVSLLARYTRFPVDSTLELPGWGQTYTTDRPVAVTDSNGVFLLQATSPFAAESLAVLVRVVDRPAIAGPLVRIPQSVSTVTKHVTYDERTGCSGCGTDPHSEEIVVGYIYVMDSLSARITY
jgi:hypothetical protein